MPDRAYFLTLGLLFAAVAADIALRGGADLLFLVRKIFDLMDYLIFWR
jgi:hypothetical protein